MQALFQQFSDMLRMVLDTKVSPNQYSHPRRCPQLVAPAVGYRSATKQDFQLFKLVVGKQSWPTRDGVAAQTTSLTRQTPPAVQRCQRNPKNLGYNTWRLARLDQLHGPHTSSFQFFRASFRSHTFVLCAAALSVFTFAGLSKRETGRLANLSDEERQGVLNNYYKGLQQVFSAEYKRADTIFFKTLGFGALMNVLPTFLDLCLQHYHGFRVADVANLFRRIDYFDFGAWHQRGTGSGAEILAGDDLRTELQGAFEGDKVQKTIKLE